MRQQVSVLLLFTGIPPFNMVIIHHDNYTPQALSKQEMAANFVFQFACNHLFSLPVPSVRSIPSAAELDDLAGFQQLCQCALDGDLTDIWAFGHDLALGDLAEVVFDDLAHPVGLGKPLGGQQLDSALKIPISRRQNAQHIGHEGRIIVRPLVPVAGAGLQGLIIGLLGVGDQLFNADIFADKITGAVQKQQRQEPAHAAVAVVEGMDAEKVQNKDWNEQQWIKFGVLYGRLESIA